MRLEPPPAPANVHLILVGTNLTRWPVALAHYFRIATSCVIIVWKMPRYQFSAQEYVNMVLIYAEWNYDGARALRMYAERYPNAHQPRNSRVIVSALVRMLNNEPVLPRRSGGGPRPVISVR